MKTPILSKLIASKKFDYVNSSIHDDLFPKPKSISSDYKLYHFDVTMDSEEVIEKMATEGFRPANAWELTQWPDWNEKDTVIALGSVGEVGGDRRVPCLDEVCSERQLGLSWWVGGWHSRCRFLAVRNLESGVSETGKMNSVSLALGFLEEAEKLIKKAKKLLE